MRITGTISEVVLYTPENGLVIVSSFSFGWAGITRKADTIVRTNLTTRGSRSFFSRSNRNSPGIIKGSPRRVATRGSDELVVGSLATCFWINLKHSLRYWVVKVIPESLTNFSILKLSFLILRLTLLWEKPRSQTEILTNLKYMFHVNFVNLLVFHSNWLFFIELFI